jgi:hypothetical protein
VEGRVGQARDDGVDRCGEPMLGGEVHATSWQLTIGTTRRRHSAQTDPAVRAR